MIELVDWGSGKYALEFEGVHEELKKLRQRILTMFGDLSGAPHSPLEHQMRLSNNDLLCNWFATIEQIMTVALSWKQLASGAKDEHGNYVHRPWKESDQTEAQKRLDHCWHVVKRCQHELEHKVPLCFGQGV
jgi:hypothetical protein